jgi:hypothetical protein
MTGGCGWYLLRSDFFLDIFFDPEGRSDVFLLNVG